MFDNVQIKLEGGFEVDYPKLMRVRQKFRNEKINDIPQAIHRQFEAEDVRVKIKPDMKVAVAVGSRGIANLQLIVASVVAEIKRLGGKPFIVPAMGSHGGATAEGQREVLAEYGITEDLAGCPIRASMETVQVGHLPNGLPLYFDKMAYESDAIVIVARVKPHTDFKGPVESGLQKMLVIGLGKHKGATSIHSYGVDRFYETIPTAGKILIEKTNAAIGVALIENAYDDTCQIIAMPAEKICDEEPKLLKTAKESMPKLLFDDIDVLVIDEFGKDVSGAGMDPNVTGRTNMGNNIKGFDAPPIQKIVVRDLTDKSHGNATGIGMADIITARFFNKIDLASTYINTITSTTLADGKIPLVIRNDREALAVALKTCTRISYDKAKIVWIKNTLKLEHIYVSETYIDYVRSRDDLELTNDIREIWFDHEGNLANPFDF